MNSCNHIPNANRVPDSCSPTLEDVMNGYHSGLPIVPCDWLQKGETYLSFRGETKLLVSYEDAYKLIFKNNVSDKALDFAFNLVRNKVFRFIDYKVKLAFDLDKFKRNVGIFGEDGNLYEVKG